jgi:hypothetical protein
MALKLPPPLRVETVLGAIDTSARATAGRARALALPVVQRTIPARSGRLRQGTRPSVRRTPVGYIIRFAPTSRVRYPNGVTAAEVFRWVSGGTGVHGPRKRRITPRRSRAFALPSGFRSTDLEGQKPQHLFERAQTSADALVERTLAAGAYEAARAAERVLGGL